MSDFEIPDSGAVFTYGKCRFAENKPSHFFIKNDPIVDVACGDEHTIVLCQSGRVFAFGSNEYGQLGLGHSNLVTRPSCVKNLKPYKIKLIACGRSHSITVTELNHVFTFGNNSDGQLGHGNTIDRNLPVRVTDISLKLHEKIIQISAGSSHTCVLTDKGRLFLWGLNTEGQLGLDIDRGIERVTSPAVLTFDEKINFVSCGSYFTAIVGESGNVFMFGENENGKLGVESNEKSIVFPQVVNANGTKFDRVFSGGHHSFLVSESGEIFGLGFNEDGQLGLDTTNNDLFITTPMKIGFFFEENDALETISCGDRHTAFLTRNGKVYTCGDGKHGKLCNLEKSETFVSKPELVSSLSDYFITSISCGGCHTIINVRKTQQDLQKSSLMKTEPILPKINLPSMSELDTDSEYRKSFSPLSQFSAIPSAGVISNGKHFDHFQNSFSTTPTSLTSPNEKNSKFFHQESEDNEVIEKSEHDIKLDNFSLKSPMLNGNETKNGFDKYYKESTISMKSVQSDENEGEQIETKSSEDDNDNEEIVDYGMVKEIDGNGARRGSRMSRMLSSLKRSQHFFNCSSKINDIYASDNDIQPKLVSDQAKEKSKTCIIL